MATTAEAKKIHKEVTDKQVKYDQSTKGKASGALFGQGEQPFIAQVPREYFPHISHEEYRDIKNRIPRSWGERFIDDRDIALIKERERQALNQEFDQWVLRQMLGKDGNTDPDKLDRLRKNFPQVYNSRWQHIKDKLDLAKRHYRIRMQGPRSREDFVYLFALERGYIVPPEVDLDGGIDKEQDGRGLFNPLRYRTVGRRVFNRRKELDINQPGGLGAFSGILSAATMGEHPARTAKIAEQAGAPAE